MSEPVDPPDNVAQGFVDDDDINWPLRALHGAAREFTVSTDPRDFGATHRLRYEDGTEELLRVDGGVVLERLA